MRLIDADAFRWWVNALYDCTELGQIVTEWIDDRPTIEAEPVRRGHWKVFYHGENMFSFACSKCYTPSGWKTKYCSGCGAKMEEQE
jgi:hypothetical protein